MKFLAPARLRVEKDICTLIHRRLRGKGVVRVSIGQEVIPSDIIGSAEISSGFRIIKLAQLLKVSASEVGGYLKRSMGQRIYKGELLAFRDSWLVGGKVNVVSPTDGVLDYLNPETGELRLTFLPTKQELPAGVYGIVEAIDNEKGIISIKTQVSRVHGLFGSGMVRDGILHIASKRDELVWKSMITPSQEGRILVGGSLLYKDAISAAISCGVSGIITGGINAKEYKGMVGGRLVFPKKLDNDVGISIVVCEGFGSIPIGEDIYEMLLQYKEKFVSIDGNAGIVSLPSFDSNSIIRVRNTSLKSTEDNGQKSYSEKVEQGIELKEGAKVRIIGNTYAGEQGKIVFIDQTETLIPSGLKTFMVTIETKRRKLQVPVANIEVIL